MENAKLHLAISLKFISIIKSSCTHLPSLFKYTPLLSPLVTQKDCFTVNPFLSKMLSILELETFALK